MYLRNDVFPFVFALAMMPLSLAHADPASLDSELERVVGILKGSVDAGQSVRVEPFTDLTAGSDLSGSIKAGLSTAFADECKRQNLSIDRRASYIVNGKFFVTDVEALRTGVPLVLELHWELTKRTGQKVVQIMPTRVETQMKISDTEFLARAVGLTGVLASDVPSDLPESEKLSNLVLNPTAIVDGTLIKSSPSSLYAAQIRSRPSTEPAGIFKPLFPTVNNGRAYIDIPRGHEYQICIYNYSSDPIAVAPSIDGLSTFQFADSTFHDPATGKLRQKHYIISAGQNDIGRPFIGVIQGWHFSNTGSNNVGRFLVGNYGDSAANRIGIPEGQDSGAIHLQFCRCHESGSDLKRRGVGDNSKGTLIGKSESIEFQNSNLIPAEAVEFITIRYDR
jgi:hypothetical protein